MDASGGINCCDSQERCFCRRSQTLRLCVKNGSFGLSENSSNAPTDQANLALPHDLECPSGEVLSKTVIFFHNESTFQEFREGYWTSDKFMHQIEKAYKIAEIKYPSSNGWKHVWIFDHSSCYAAMPHDALDINAMKVNPGGKQCVMKATGILSLITIAIKTSIKIHLRLLCKKLEVHVMVDNVHIHVRNLKSGCIVFVLQFIL